MIRNLDKNRELVAVHLPSAANNGLWKMEKGKGVYHNLEDNTIIPAQITNGLEGLLDNGFEPIYRGDKIEVYYTVQF